MSKLIEPINRNGITCFLAEVFGDNHDGKIKRNALAKQLHRCKDFS